jgi:hypothetical protein
MNLVITQPAPPSLAATASAQSMRLRWLMARVLAAEPWQSSPFAEELQQTVRAMSAEMREHGGTPEQVIIALKRATLHGGPRPITTAADALHYRMTLWSVLEFFRCEE